MLTRTRIRIMRSAAVLAVGLTFADSSSAQLPSSGQPPKYYQGNVGQTSPRPPVEPTARPKLTSPVIAGADGVRPASASEAEALKAPAFFPPAVDVAPAEPKSTPPVEPAKLPTTSAPSIPIVPVGTLPTAPTATGLSSRQTPSVSVEFETPESSGVGQPVTYVLVVRNTGTSAVHGVRVESETPVGSTFLGSEPSAESSNEAKLAWAVGGMDAGAEKRIKVTVKASEEGEIRSRATVSFNTAVEAKFKITRPKLSITMTVPEVVRVGEGVPFKVTVNNIGTGTAIKIPLQARFTDGLKYKNEKGEAIEGLIETEWANLPAGQSKSFVLNLTAMKPGSQQCVLTVFADGNPAETCKAAVTLVEPQLVAKQSGPFKCLVKAEPTYQIDLSNPGTATTDAISAWTIVPEGFEFLSASDAGVFTPTTKAVMWRLAGLPAGGSKSVTVKLRAVAPSETSLRSVVQSGATEAPTTAGVAQANAKAKMLEVRCDTPVKAEGVPALRFEVVGLEGVVEVGKEAVYEIKVSNQGTGVCTNVQLEAELAEGTVAAGAAGPTSGRTTGQRITFDPIASLSVKGEALYKVRVKGTTAGDLRFRVKLGCDQVKTPSVKEENTRFYKE